MLKQPKKPKLPKKPSANASLQTKRSWMRRTKELHEKYNAKLKAIAKENMEREKINKESAKLSQVISGIGSIETLPSSFKVIKRRLPYSIHKKKKGIGGVGKKRRATKSKAVKRKTHKRR